MNLPFNSIQLVNSEYVYLLAEYVYLLAEYGQYSVHTCNLIE